MGRFENLVAGNPRCGHVFMREHPDGTYHCSGWDCTAVFRFVEDERFVDESKSRWTTRKAATVAVAA